MKAEKMAGCMVIDIVVGIMLAVVLMVWYF
jgi:hypothetical protein